MLRSLCAPVCTLRTKESTWRQKHFLRLLSRQDYVLRCLGSRHARQPKAQVMGLEAGAIGKTRMTHVSEPPDRSPGQALASVLTHDRCQTLGEAHCRDIPHNFSPPAYRSFAMKVRRQYYVPQRQKQPLEQFLKRCKPSLLKGGKGDTSAQRD